MAIEEKNKSGNKVVFDEVRDESSNSSLLARSIRGLTNFFNQHSPSPISEGQKRDLSDLSARYRSGELQGTKMTPDEFSSWIDDASKPIADRSGISRTI